MLKKTGFVLVIGLLVLLVAGFFLSPEFEVEQSIDIQAGPETIHPYVNDLKQWTKWTPWKQMEPDIVIRYGDLSEGVGASQSWRGKGGSGHLHITASSPENGIAYDVFFGNDTSPSISAIQYQKLGKGSTRVSWRIHGEIEMPVFGGYMAMLVSAMTRDRYRKGLLKLKELVENSKPVSRSRAQL